MVSVRGVAGAAMVAAVVLLGLSGSVALAEVRYTVTGLGTLGGSFSGAAGINDAGQVVGWADTASGEERAFLYTLGSGMTDLGTLGAGKRGQWYQQRRAGCRDQLHAKRL